MLEKPEYYARFEVEGTKWAMCISEYALPGFVRMTRKTCSPWYGTIDIANNIAVSGCWLQWVGNEIKRDANGFVSLLASATNFRGGSGASDAAKDGTYNSMLGMPRTSISKAGVRPFARMVLTRGRAVFILKLHGSSVLNTPQCTAKTPTMKHSPPMAFIKAASAMARPLMVLNGTHGEAIGLSSPAVLLQSSATTLAE